MFVDGKDKKESNEKTEKTLLFPFYYKGLFIMHMLSFLFCFRVCPK